MKNITVSIDDETYRRARIAAAANDTSVSAVVRGILAEIAAMKEDEHAAFNRAVQERLKRFLPAEPAGETPAERFERLRREEIDLRKTIKGFSASDRLGRDELYDRSRFR